MGPAYWREVVRLVKTSSLTPLRIGDINILSVLGLSRFLTREIETTQDQEYGEDTVFVGVGLNAQGLAHQLVAGIASDTFFMGLFGLSSRALIIGGSLRQTFLSTLSTWAGSKYFLQLYRWLLWKKRHPTELPARRK